MSAAVRRSAAQRFPPPTLLMHSKADRLQLAPLPPVRFSAWVPWTKRLSALDRTSESGVYLLGHFESPPPGSASPCNPSVIYIGETTGNSTCLRTRWNDFARGARTGQGHSGGNTYHDHHGAVRKDLYVAAYPVWGLGEELNPLFIKYVERKLLLEHTLAHGSSPQFNKR